MTGDATPAPSELPSGLEAFDHLATMVAVARPDGRCLMVNSTLENMMGASRRTLMRGSVLDWLTDPTPLREALRLVADNEVASGRFDATMKRAPLGVPGSHEWPVHVIAETGSIETTRAWDIDGCGIPEIVPNTPGRRDVCVFKLKVQGGKGTGVFERLTVHEFPEGQAGFALKFLA